MKRRYLTVLLIIMALVCGETYHGGELAKAGQKVAAITLYRGAGSYIKMPGNSKKKAGTKYRYTSSAPKIASVSKKGKVKGKKAGTAVVTMKSKAGKKKVFRCRIRVVDYVAKLAFSSASQIILNRGEKSQIRAEVLPKTAGERGMTFSSRDEHVAKVSQTGEVVAVDEGMTYIDVTSKGKKKNGKKVSKAILVYVNAEQGTIVAPTPVIPSLDDVVIQAPDVTVAPGGPPVATATAVPGETQPPVVTEQPGTTEQPDMTEQPGTVPPSASSLPSETEKPEEPTAVPTVAPTVAPTVTPTEKPPQTLADYIAAIPSPGPEKLLAARFLVSSQGKTSTLYFLNKSYVGNVSLVIDGITLQGAGSVNSLMLSLQTEVATVLKGPYYTDADGNSRRIFRIGRESSSDPWMIQNRRDNTAYSFYVRAEDTIYGTPYSLLIADGDTGTHIVLK